MARLRPFACGDDPSAVCDWVQDRTGNGTLASIADWFVGTPLTIVAVAVGAIALVHIVRRLIKRAMSKVAESAAARDPRAASRAKSIADFVASLAAVVIWFLAVFVVVGELGIDLAPLLAGAGVAGIALGFGAQSLVRDWLAGFFVIVEDQYGPGDVVDLGEATGVVERITLRETVLRGLDGTVWHVPNGQVTRVGNRSQLWSVAVVDIDVPHGTDLEAVKSAMVDAATSLTSADQYSSKVLEPPQLLGVEAITPDSVTLRLLVKTTPGDQWALQRALREAIRRRLDSIGVEVPLPGRALWNRITGSRSDAGPVNPDQPFGGADSRQ